jgi:chemotaxis signal transduction protein
MRNLNMCFERCGFERCGFERCEEMELWESRMEYMEGEIVIYRLGGEENIGIVLRKCISIGGHVTYIVLSDNEECWMGVENLRGRRMR